MNIQVKDLVVLVMSDDNKMLFLKPASEVPVVEDTIYIVYAINGSRVILKDTIDDSLLAIDDVKYNGEVAFTILVDAEENLEEVVKGSIQRVKRSIWIKHDTLLDQLGKKMDESEDDPITYDAYLAQYKAIKVLVTESLKAL